MYYLETGACFLPSNVYFVRCGSSWVLTDAGWANCARAIKEAAESEFGANTHPAAILLTHLHPDHDGSALELSGLWNLPVSMHPAEMPLTVGTIAAVEAYPAGPIDRWVIPPITRTMPHRWEAILAKESLRDRARSFDPDGPIPGLPDWECIPTPGHTPGHVSYFRPSDRVLITGDAIVTMKVNSLWGLFHRPGLSGPPWYTSSSWSEAKASIAALARLEPGVLATGHGLPMSGPETARQLTDFSRRLAEKSRDSRSIAAHIQQGGRAMTHVQGEIIINRSVEEVFDFVADERNEPRYNPAMVRSDLITGEPIGVGSRFQATMTGRGRSSDMTIEFTTFERPRRFESSTHLSTMEIDGMLTFEPVPAGTRMRWFWDLHPHGVLRFLTPLVTYIGRRQEKTIWTGLKRYLESREVSVPSPG